MPDTPMDLVILDTETLGLDPDAPIWEFAALRRFAGGGEERTEFQIQHQPEPWLSRMADDRHGEQFIADYKARYNRDDAVTESNAAIMMNLATAGALVIACNPVFDLPRIDKLICQHGMTPEYHYHPFDISSAVFGAVVAYRPFIDQMAEVHTGLLGIPSSTFDDYLPGPPWKSDRLAAAVGVRSEDYARHTAMGDVLWTVAQWDAITGGVRG